MADYDIDKVSPRPWKLEHEFTENTIIRDGGGRALYHGSDSDWLEDRGIPYREMEKHNIPHIVHCVNAHDPLLQFVRDIAGEDRTTSIETRDEARALLKEITT